jgi:hypothetical protein
METDGGQGGSQSGAGIATYRTGCGGGGGVGGRGAWMRNRAGAVERHREGCRRNHGAGAVERRRGGGVRNHGIARFEQSATAIASLRSCAGFGAGRAWGMRGGRGACGCRCGRHYRLEVGHGVTGLWRGAGAGYAGQAQGMWLLVRLPLPA